MSRLIKISICFVTALFILSCNKHKTAHHDIDGVVYISTSTKAYAYHCDSHCKWLIKTTHPIKEVSLDVAEEMERKPCRQCCE